MTLSYIELIQFRFISNCLSWLNVTDMLSLNYTYLSNDYNKINRVGIEVNRDFRKRDKVYDMKYNEKIQINLVYEKF